jgi:hypothetical protein
VLRRSLFLYQTLFQNMFRPKWPSSGAQVVVFQDSAAHCNAVFFLLLLLHLVILVMWVARGCLSTMCDALC